MVAFTIAALALISVFPLNRDAAPPILIFATVAVGALFLVGVSSSTVRHQPVIAAFAIIGILGVFATIYRSVSLIRPGSISGLTDAWDALYFSVVVGSTLGFGDITPAEPLTKMIVVVELLLVGALVVTIALAFSRQRKP